MVAIFLISSLYLNIVESGFFYKFKMFGFSNPVFSSSFVRILFEVTKTTWILI